MKLLEIEINNYKSIECLNIPINSIEDTSYTYGLIGINEAGKSAILNAIAIVDTSNEYVASSDVFYNDADEIIINFKYKIDNIDSKIFDSTTDNFLYVCKIQKSHTPIRRFYLQYYGNDGENIVVNLASSDLEKFDTIIDKIHKVKFWTFKEHYLIDKEIYLNQGVITIKQNIPLNNCFLISGINPEEFIENISDSIKRELYQDKLTKKVSTFISERWPNKDLEIRFNLTESKINFHIRDKTADASQKLNQRSDGLKQILSFLLSIAADNSTNSLSKTIILLDEPEIHLHPQAQKNFLKEIIDLTKNQHGNILFYTTHSSFLIDKEQIDRNAIVKKIDSSLKTDIKFIEKQ
ncbi:MAG: ATP-dependent nuclease [Leadbetterella sp.]